MHVDTWTKMLVNYMVFSVICIVKSQLHNMKDPTHFFLTVYMQKDKQLDSILLLLLKDKSINHIKPPPAIKAETKTV